MCSDLASGISRSISVKANNIVIRVAGGVDAVLRSDIAAMEPSKLSLMPAGFESALRPPADLLSWLRAP